MPLVGARGQVYLSTTSFGRLRTHPVCKRSTDRGARGDREDAAGKSVEAVAPRVGRGVEHGLRELGRDMPGYAEGLEKIARAWTRGGRKRCFIGGRACDAFGAGTADAIQVRLSPNRRTKSKESAVSRTPLR